MPEPIRPRTFGGFRIPRSQAPAATGGPRRLTRHIPAAASIGRGVCLKDDLGGYLRSQGGEFLLARIDTLTIVDSMAARALQGIARQYKAEILIVNSARTGADLKDDVFAVEALGILTNQWFAISAKGPDAALALKHLQTVLTTGDYRIAEVIENTAMREMVFKGRPLTAKISISRALVLKDTLDLDAFPIIDMKAEADRQGRTLDEQMAASIEAMSTAVREMEESLARDGALAQAAGNEADYKMAEAFQCMIIEVGAKILGLMEEKGICAAAAVRELLKPYEPLKTSPDPKWQAGYFDVHSLCIKVLAIRHKKSIDIREEIDNCGLGSHIILAAENIAASDSGVIADRRIDGAVREKGAAKDHMSLRLRDHEKAGVIAAAGVTALVHTGDTVVVDGRTGRVILNPTPETLRKYEALKAEYDRLDDFLRAGRQDEPVTLDGQRVKLMGNAASADDVDSIVRRHNQAGVGLVRTELFFCEHTDLSQRSEEPSVEEQVGFYDQVIMTAGAKEVIFRTVDVDPADKTFPYFEPPVETAGAERKKGLGLCLDKENNAPYYYLFRNQLKAYLLTTGRAKVMFPLVRSSAEFRSAMALVEDVKRELLAKQKTVNKKLIFGAMVEHPDIIKDMPAEAEFFSLGTSDLTQFVTSVSRYAPLGSQNFDELDPRVLKAIADAIAKARAAGKPISCCGDMGNDWRSMLVMMALGLDTFSVSTGTSDIARYIIRNIKRSDLAVLLKGIHGIKTAREIRRFIDEFTREKMRPSERDGQVVPAEWQGLVKIEKLLFLDEAA